MPSPAHRRSPRRPRRGPTEIELHGLTHGGEAVGRLPDGKACFVPYAIPGERVRVQVTDERKSWARGRLLEILEPSPDRVDPPCPYFGPDRCGGCQLQHVDPARQAQMKRRIVTEQLERIGRFTAPPVAETVVVGPLGYRSQARFAVDERGRLGFRSASSHDVVAIDRCLLLDEDTQALRERAGDGWGDVEEVTVRTAAGTGGGCLVVVPGPGPLPPLPADDVPVAIVDSRGAALPLRGSPVLTHEIAGHRYTVSATSFFQSSPAGARVLVELVRRAIRPQAGQRILDLYAGVGLFSVALAEPGVSVVAVESHPAAADDARTNLAAVEATVVRADVEDAVAAQLAAGARYDAVVLDPPRKGAGTQVCAGIAELGAPVVVYVSCDPAALARDARGLCDAGYTLAQVVPVDQFAQTSHVESVAAFRRHLPAA
jgi:23S rRNA (uracil1939-C5)-methyltransferase